MSNPITNKSLQDLAESQREAFDLPGISIAVWQDGQLHQAAAGHANLQTGVKVCPDTVFQIGSITKVMTSCLVMQLVDEGRVELDQPVKRYLHDFQVACPEATAAITVRQLLNHTNGMAGDFFPDDNGHTGNLIARYIDRCNLLPQVHPMGEQFAYSNSAFVVAGRLVEVLRGISWYQAMEDYIFKPLGMSNALADPKELIRFKAAMGHIKSEDGETWEQPDQAWLTVGMAPCGATPTMSTGDLIAFARAHLEGGKALNGERWLSPESIAAMQVEEIGLPCTSQSVDRQMGLGWFLKDYVEGPQSYGHTGATFGFYSSLEIFPESNTAFAFLINAVAPPAFKAIQRALLQEVTGFEFKEPDIDKSIALTDQHRSIAGVYESFDKRIVVRCDEEGINAHWIYKVDPLPPENLRLFPIAEGCFGAESEAGVRRANLAFVYEQGQSQPAYLFDGSRLNPRLPNP